jgi:hypothetical protein
MESSSHEIFIRLGLGAGGLDFAASFCTSGAFSAFIFLPGGEACDAGFVLKRNKQILEELPIATQPRSIHLVRLDGFFFVSEFESSKPVNNARDM